MCADFQCAWLEDANWPDPWRPDRSGLLCLRAPLNGSAPAAVVYEVSPNALQSPPGGQILAELEQTTAIVVVVDDDRKRRRIVGDWLPHLPEAVPRRPHFRSAPARSEAAEPGEARRREAS